MLHIICNIYDISFIGNTNFGMVDRPNRAGIGPTMNEPDHDQDETFGPGSQNVLNRGPSPTKNPQRKI